jgi:hypothetical protein
MLQAAGGPRAAARPAPAEDTALDIEAPGAWDRDSGAGIIDALAVVGAARNPFTDPAPGGVASAVHFTQLRDHQGYRPDPCGNTRYVLRRWPSIRMFSLITHEDDAWSGHGLSEEGPRALSLAGSILISP